MTENKRYIVKGSDDFFQHIEDTTLTEDRHEGAIYNIYQVVRRLNEQDERIKELEKFEHTGEHIRLSINIKTGKLQRHIYATGQWFGDFDRVLVKNFINEKDYQRFIDRVIEVYNNEFKGDMG